MSRRRSTLLPLNLPCLAANEDGTKGRLRGHRRHGLLSAPSCCGRGRRDNTREPTCSNTDLVRCRKPILVFNRLSEQRKDCVMSRFRSAAHRIRPADRAPSSSRHTGVSVAPPPLAPPSSYRRARLQDSSGLPSVRYNSGSTNHDGWMAPCEDSWLPGAGREE